MCIDLVLNLKNKRPGELQGKGVRLGYDKLSAKNDEYPRPLGTQPSSPFCRHFTTSLAGVRNEDLN
jgi:hypothetical protein